MQSGALYHHFANLAEVMEAVFATVERELLADVERALTGLGDSRERLLRAGREVLDVAVRDQAALRIVFVEAPVARRWSQWRAVDGGRSLGFIKDLLEAAAHDGHLVAGIDPELAGQLILGAINEACIYAARTSTSEGLERMQAQVELLVRGLLARV